MAFFLSFLLSLSRMGLGEAESRILFSIVSLWRSFCVDDACFWISNDFPFSFLVVWQGVFIAVS